MPDLLETKPRNQTGNQRILGMQKGGEKMNVFWLFMLINFIFQLSWLIATCFLIYTGHYIWAIFTFLGAFLSGYTYNKGKVDKI